MKSSPSSKNPDSQRIVIDRRTAEADIAIMPMLKMETSSMRFRMGMARKFRKKGIGRSQTIMSVARLYAA